MSNKKVMTIDVDWVRGHSELFGELRLVVGFAALQPEEERDRLLRAVGEQLESLRKKFSQYAKELR